jgi:O-antigen/teichoic acid export membrane protein
MLMRERGTRGKLARGAVGSIGLTVIKNMLQIGVVVLLARLLAPSGYGRYAFAMSLASIFGIVVTLGLPGLLIREVATGEAQEQWGFVRGLIRRADQAVLLTLALVVPAGMAALLLWPNVSWVFRLTLVFALAYLVFNTFGQLRGAQLMGLRHVIAGQVGLLCAQPGFLLMSVLVVVYIAGATLSSARALLLAAIGAFLVFLINAALARRVRPHPLKVAKPSYATRNWLRSAIPFAVMSGLFLFNSQIDIVMLGFLTKSKDVGLYRVAASGASLLPLILTAINPVLGPTFARLHALSDHARLRRAVRTGALLSLLGAIPIFIIYLFLGGHLIQMVLGKAYIAAWLPLTILSGGQLVNAAMGPVGLLLNMTRHERDTAWVLGASVALNVALNATLIPLFGMTGAAAATATSLLVWNVALALRVRKHLGYFPAAFV